MFCSSLLLLKNNLRLEARLSFSNDLTDVSLAGMEVLGLTAGRAGEWMDDMVRGYYISIRHAEM